jgi:hypothetical protein
LSNGDACLYCFYSSYYFARLRLKVVRISANCYQFEVVILREAAGRERDMGAKEIQSEPRPNLIDVIIILVICSAIALFVFWLATRTMDQKTFDQLPDWLKGSYSAVFSVLTGTAGIGAAVLHELRRPPNTSPNYLKLIGRCLAALFAMILLIILIVRFIIPVPVPPVPPVPTPSPTPTVRTLSHVDVSREGHMRDIQVTVIRKPNGTGSFTLTFNWTGGGGGTWSGNQTATITLRGENRAVLQSVVIGINRSGCFYGPGNVQTAGGELTVDPDLIIDFDVTLSEVQNRTQGVC